MYSTCLFCHSELGKNEVIEHFPVGRRLAFDMERGRLWVVCRTCERWNLTPVEERWEAMEECERAFRSTRLRMSTDHIGLARVSEGLELVRVGQPQRPEMAAWRYGDQFGNRRRRYYAYAAGAAVMGGAVVIGGIQAGIFAGAGVNMLNILSFGHNALWSRRTVAHVPTPEGRVRVARGQLQTVKITSGVQGQPVLQFDRRLQPGEKSTRMKWWQLDMVPRRHGMIGGIVSGRRVEIPLSESAAALGALLPVVNAQGGSRRVVSDAVRMLEERGTGGLLEDAGTAAARPGWYAPDDGRLSKLPAPLRLALEMSTHEDDERRALEGELAALEERWKEAEEIAEIADNMFVPRSISDWIARMRS